MKPTKDKVVKVSATGNNPTGKWLDVISVTIVASWASVNRSRYLFFS